MSDSNGESAAIIKLEPPQTGALTALVPVRPVTTAGRRAADILAAMRAAYLDAFERGHIRTLYELTQIYGTQVKEDCPHCFNWQIKRDGLTLDLLVRVLEPHEFVPGEHEPFIEISEHNGERQRIVCSDRQAGAERFIVDRWLRVVEAEAVARDAAHLAAAQAAAERAQQQAEAQARQERLRELAAQLQLERELRPA
jgi:hypothetical protein